MYQYIVKVRSAILVFLTHSLALPFLKLVRKPTLFPFTPASLMKMPAGTLGRDLVEYLHHKNLQLLPYYAKHDIKHILLEYDTTDRGEVCLQCFMLGNRHMSFPVIATVAYGIFTMPEYWKYFYQAFKRGRQCGPVEPWKWFEILQVQTNELRKRIV